MTIIVRNCRGIELDTFLEQMDFVKFLYKLDMLLVLDTKINENIQERAGRVIIDIGFDKFYTIPSTRLRGLVVLENKFVQNALHECQWPMYTCCYV